jgi:hypothetical protein
MGGCPCAHEAPAGQREELHGMVELGARMVVGLGQSRLLQVVVVEAPLERRSLTAAKKGTWFLSTSMSSFNCWVCCTTAKLVV